MLGSYNIPGTAIFSGKQNRQESCLGTCRQVEKQMLSKHLNIRQSSHYHLCFIVESKINFSRRKQERNGFRGEVNEERAPQGGGILNKGQLSKMWRVIEAGKDVKAVK